MLPVCLEKGTKVDLWSQFWEVEICRSVSYLLKKS